MRRQLGHMLVAQGKITATQLETALQRQGKDGARLGEVVTSQGFASEEDVVAAVSEQLQVAYVASKALVDIAVPERVLKHIPAATAERLQVLPLAMRSPSHLIIATTEPNNLHLMNELQFVSSVGKVTPVLATPTGIRLAIRALYYGEKTPHWNQTPWGQEHNSLEMLESGLRPYADKVTGTREHLYAADELDRGGLLVSVATRDEVTVPLGLYQAAERLLSAVVRAPIGSLEPLAALGELASKVARKLGGNVLAAEKASLGVRAVHFAAALEQCLWQLPEQSTLSTLMGHAWPALQEAIGPCTRQGGAWARGHGPDTLAIGATYAFACAARGCDVSAAEALAALKAVAEAGSLPATALEALTAEVTASSPKARGNIVLMLPPSPQALALQLKLTEDGFQVSLIRSVDQLSGSLVGAAQGFVLDAQTRNFDPIGWVRSVRQDPSKARLPIFLIASESDGKLVDQAMEAGADDVLAQPNAAVVSAKLRRAGLRQPERPA